MNQQAYPCLKEVETPMPESGPKHKLPLKGILSRLRNDVAGNTMMLVAGAAIPLLAGIGVAIDMGRLYATNTKLQSACDAAVLGGRKSMIANAWTPHSKDVADNFFHNNFPSGKYGSNTENIVYSTATDGEVSAVAKAKLPMMIMRLFGTDQKNLTTTCKAQLQMGNTDVMFVLDTTGSMAETNPSDTVTRMEALKTAVSNFHTSLEAAKGGTVSTRYGFVPYANTVNVGYLLQADWMVDRWTYQSRVPAGTNTSGAGTSMHIEDVEWQEMGGSQNSSTSNLPLEACNKPTDTVVWQPWTTISTSSSAYAGPPAGTRTETVYEYPVDGNLYYINQTATTCQLTTVTYNHLILRFKRITYPIYTTDTTSHLWDYRPVEYDVSALKGLTSGGTITAPINSDQTNRTINWRGCIEERDTVRETDYSSIPAGAWDMDIDKVPDSDDTRWRPALPELVYARYSFDSPSGWYVPAQTGIAGDYWNVGDKDGGAWATCPPQAKKLSPMTASDVSTYLDTLIPSGGTYHDIGMVWGARLLSPTGLFASENATATNGGSISRHLIFMTDGFTDTSPMVYDAYGWPALDRRRVMDPNVAPTKADQDTLVENRLEALCTVTKAKGITVWVIAFGVTATGTMNDCSSNGTAYSASNATQLNEAFASIASNIAGLRLTR